MIMNNYTRLLKFRITKIPVLSVSEQPVLRSLNTSWWSPIALELRQHQHTAQVIKLCTAFGASGARR